MNIQNSVLGTALLVVWQNLRKIADGRHRGITTSHMLKCQYTSEILRDNAQPPGKAG